MSTISNNGKFINLDGVKVYYNRKNNSIQLISSDDDLVGKPFQITLNQGTETEATLRELLLETGVIKPSENSLTAQIPKFMTMPSNKIKGSTWNKIPIGVGANSVPFFLDLNIAPHMLVTGATGTGKSVFLRSLILHCLKYPNDWRFVGIDVKKVELSPYKQYKDLVLDIATTLEEANETIDAAIETMNNRYRLMDKVGIMNFKDLEKYTGASVPAIMFMIEEAFMLLARHPQPGDEYREGMKAKLEEIARLGRAAGIYLVIATQRPDATVINGQLKANLDTRIVIGKNSGTISQMVLGNSDATLLPLILGRGLVKSAGLYVNNKRIYDTNQFQTYFSKMVVKKK